MQEKNYKFMVTVKPFFEDEKGGLCGSSDWV